MPFARSRTCLRYKSSFVVSSAGKKSEGNHNSRFSSCFCIRSLTTPSMSESTSNLEDSKCFLSFSSEPEGFTIRDLYCVARWDGGEKKNPCVPVHCDELRAGG